MAKMKAQGPAPIRPKIFASLDEITQGIEKLRGRVVQVEELKKDGLPYRDAFRVTTEFQIRDTIREIFGEHSPEYHEHRNLQIKANSKAGINETVSLLQNLILSLEDKRLALLGIRQRPSVPPTTGTNRAVKEAAPQAPPTASQGSEVHQSVNIQAQASNPTQAPRTTPPPPAEVKRPQEVQVADKLTKSSPPQRSQSRPVALKLSAEVHVSETQESAQAQPPVVTPPPPVTPPSTATPQPTQPCPVPRSQGGHQESKVNMEASAVPSRSADAKPALDALDLIRKLCTRFHGVARQLRHRGDDRTTLEVEDEIDVQDVLHALLYIDFDDIQIETWTPSYAHGSNRTDLLIKPEGIVILVKKTKQGGGAKTLIDQLSADIRRYSAHSECKALVCFVYDPEGRIGNPKGLEAELSREQNGRRVIVIISPK